MSTKRFLLDDAGELIDITNHQFIEYGEEVCELLNQLNDENEELKHNCKTYTWYKQYKIVLNENAHLKSDLKELHKICKQYEQKLHELKSVINTLQIGISKMMQSIKEDREHHALIVGIEILKKLEEKGFLGEKE